MLCTCPNPSCFIKCDERQILWPTKHHDDSASLSIVPLFSPRMQISRWKSHLPSSPHEKALTRKLPLCLRFSYIHKKLASIFFCVFALKSDHCAGSKILPVIPQCGFSVEYRSCQTRPKARCSAIMSACSAPFHLFTPRYYAHMGLTDWASLLVAISIFVAGAAMGIGWDEMKPFWWQWGCKSEGLFVQYNLQPDM